MGVLASLPKVSRPLCMMSGQVEKGAMAMPVTIRQVAAIAGVSIATVSHVLNGKGSMTIETRQRVQSAIADSGYLRQRKTGSDLAFVSAVQNGFGSVAIRQAAAEYGFDTHLVVAADTLDAPPPFDLAKRIAGVVVYGGQWKRRFLEPILSAYPTVLLGSYLPTTRSDAVWVDNAGGVYAATDYLIRRGHRCIGMINGPDKSATSAEKQIGFTRALRHANLPDCGLVVETINFSFSQGRYAANKLLSSKPRPTAIVAGETAFGAATLATCAELGLKVPDDVSLITFHDNKELETSHPPVTALRIPELAICREAIWRLVVRIGNPLATGQRVLLQPEIFERSSVCTLNT